jgi:hypothetical protein
MPGSLMAQGDLEAVNGVDGWVACGSAPYDHYARFWSKAHMHQVVSDLVRQVKCFNYRGRANA